MLILLPVPPASNRYWRCWRGRMVKSDEARAYKQKVVLAWMRTPGTPTRMLSGPVTVTIRWYREAKRGDLDGRLKVALDCLQGLGFKDDKQIVRIVAERFEDKANPRLEVDITAA